MHTISLHVAMVNGTKQKDIQYFFDQMPRLLFSLLFVSVRLLLKGCVYFFEKLEYINDSWIGSQERYSDNYWMLSVVCPASQSCSQPWKRVAQRKQH